MKGTLSRWAASVPAGTTARALQEMINPIGDRVSSVVLTTPALAIKAGGGVLVKCTEPFYVAVQGKMLLVADNTDMAALSGTVTADAFNVYCFYIDKAATQSSLMGAEGATLNAVKFPPIPEGKTWIGFVIINPTGTGNFVGGTTPLDDATVTPNAVYVNLTGVSFDPTVLL